jgi:hypothetical protein
MANECKNLVTVEGAEEILNKLEELFIENLEYETFNEWCAFVLGIKYSEEHSLFEYGTKYWEVDENINWVGDTLEVFGNSAWAPPTEFLRLVSEKYSVTISNSYGEEGNNFGGYWKCVNGVVVEDIEVGYTEWVYRYAPASVIELYQWLEVLIDSGTDWETFKETELESFSKSLTEEEVSAIKEEWEEVTEGLS